MASTGGCELSKYLDTANDVEHILPQQSQRCRGQAEFGKNGDDDAEYIQSLGNLIWLERSINRAIGNAAYSVKATVFTSYVAIPDVSRCQAVRSDGRQVNDADYPKAVARLDPAAPTWTRRRGRPASEAWMARARDRNLAC